MHQSTRPSVNSSIGQLVHQSTRPSVNSCINQLVHRSTRPSVNSVNSSIGQLVHRSNRPSVSSSIVNSSFSQLINQSTRPSVNSSSSQLVQQSTHPAVKSSTSRVVQQSSRPAVNSSSKQVVQQSSRPSVKSSISQHIHQSTLFFFCARECAEKNSRRSIARATTRPQHSPVTARRTDQRDQASPLQFPATYPTSRRPENQRNERPQDTASILVHLRRQARWVDLRKTDGTSRARPAANMSTKVVASVLHLPPVSKPTTTK